jgi:hypothetical protein
MLAPPFKCAFDFQITPNRMTRESCQAVDEITESGQTPILQGSLLVAAMRALPVAATDVRRYHTSIA